MIIGGPIVNIIKKSEKAKLTTKRLAGVRRDFVDMKTEMTTPFPAKETIVKRTMMNPKMLCHRGFSGWNWYLWGKLRIILIIVAFFAIVCGIMANLFLLPMVVDEVKHVRKYLVNHRHVTESGNGHDGLLNGSPLLLGELGSAGYISSVTHAEITLNINSSILCFQFRIL
jgi:hypothetical protein